METNCLIQVTTQPVGQSIDHLLIVILFIENHWGCRPIGWVIGQWILIDKDSPQAIARLVATVNLPFLPILYLINH